MLASRRSGTSTDDIYTPNLWYFDTLLFLKDQEVPINSVGNDNFESLDFLNRVIM